MSMAHGGGHRYDPSAETTSPPQRSSLVSAVIPVYNGREFIQAAIESVFAQSHASVECVVVDDGSTDGTGELVARMTLPVRYVRQTNMGVARARNVGAAAAEGEYLAFLDADDVWEPEKISQQLLSLDQAPFRAAVCACTVTDAAGRNLRVVRMDSRSGSLVDMVLFAGASVVSTSSTALMARHDFFALGGFDERLSTSADWDFLARCILRDGGVAYVDDPLVRYRLHGRNMSRRIEAVEEDMQYCFRKLFSDPNLPSEVKVRERAAYAGLYKMLAGSYLDVSNYGGAARAGVRSMQNDPRALCGVALRRVAIGRRRRDT